MIVVVFGVRELPNPRGEGYLWYRLHPSGYEFFVDYLNLYEISEEELRTLFVRAVQKVYDTLITDESNKEVPIKIYRTENMSDWVVALLEEVIDQFCMKGRP